MLLPNNAYNMRNCSDFLIPAEGTHLQLILSASYLWLLSTLKTPDHKIEGEGNRQEVSVITYLCYAVDCHIAS